MSLRVVKKWIKRMENRAIDKVTSDKISFITYIVPEFAAAYKMKVQDAFFYLKKYGGWSKKPAYNVPAALRGRGLTKAWVDDTLANLHKCSDGHTPPLYVKTARCVSGDYHSRLRSFTPFEFSSLLPLWINTIL